MLSRFIRKRLSQFRISRNCRHSSTVALKNAFDTIERYNPDINAFISLNDPLVLREKAKASDSRQSQGKPLSPMDGVTIAIKDNICTSFLPTTCASNMLRDFTSPYDATVVKLLDDAGALIVGKTNMDEFGMGSYNVHSVFGPVVNPIGYSKQERRSAGGSSGGSAASVAMKMCTVALGSDTGGSVRMPASYCGLVGFKPTYGRCSRNGLVAYANSLDTIGILTQNVRDCSDVYDIISHYDIRDPTSIPNELRNQLDNQQEAQLSRFKSQGSLKGLVVGIPQEFYIDSLSSQVLNVWRKGIEHLKNSGATIKSVSIPHLSLALPAYYIIALAEASSNLSRYDGIRYGYRSSDVDRADHKLLYEATRSDGFGHEVQRRILLGTHLLTAGTFETLFLPAQKARRLIQNEFNLVFSQPNLLNSSDANHGDADILLVPSATSAAPNLVDSTTGNGGLEEYIDDVMTLPANLAGIPAITVPFEQDENEFPIGLQLLGQYGHDKFVLHVAEQMTTK
ncbi:amidase signature domain-containing protein [Parasitella parasitica]|nr:amidase signature domain-containing protein [Parasitella parasitica]